MSNQSVISEDVRPPRDLPEVPVLYAHGDIDDHLRLTTQLGDALGARLGLPEARRASKRADIPWPSRLTALKALLREAKSRQQPVACLVDPDALYQTKLDLDRLWGDASFVRERQELFNVLKASLAEGGWWWVRPSANAGVSAELEDMGHKLSDGSAQGPLERVSAALRTMAQGLVDFAGMPERQLNRFLEETPPEALDLVILELAYNSLHVLDVRAAWRLAVQRGAQQMNGLCGALPWISKNPAGVDLESVKRLVARGWLTQMGSSLYMAPVIRRFLADWADLEDLGERRRAHQLAAGSTRHDLVGTMERHYHAIEIDDVGLAIETATYYGADLRRIAIRQSFDHKWAESARLYKTIVDRYDSSDAYAWEYLGYNLARDEGDPLEIEDAYKNAVKEDPLNPLYHGRLIGFRWAEMEQEQRDAFGRWLRQFQWSTEQIGWFAKPVIRALRRRGRQAAIDELMQDWGVVLRRSEKVRALLQ